MTVSVAPEIFAVHYIWARSILPDIWLQAATRTAALCFIFSFACFPYFEKIGGGL
jgi:hypothetical protein